MHKRHVPIVSTYLCKKGISLELFYSISFDKNLIYMETVGDKRKTYDEAVHYLSHPLLSQLLQISMKLFLVGACFATSASLLF